jgi:hypothetical protein
MTSNDFPLLSKFPLEIQYIILTLACLSQMQDRYGTNDYEELAKRVSCDRNLSHWNCPWLRLNDTSKPHNWLVSLVSACSFYSGVGPSYLRPPAQPKRVTLL